MAIQDIAASPNEVLVTLIASISVAIITAFQIMALLQKNSPQSRSAKSSPSPLVTAQIVYGLLVFVGFTCWAFNLFTSGLLPWAGLSGVTALVGLMMPFWVWKKANAPLPHAQTNEPHNFDDINDSDLQPALAALADLSETVSEAENASTDEPVEPETFDLSLEAELNQSVQAVSPGVAVSPVYTYGTAEDAKSLESLCNRPSDSVLKRHYDQLVSAENTKFNSFISIVEPVDTEQEIDASVAQNASVQNQPSTLASLLKLPQDSILKRHYDQLVSAENAKFHSSISIDETDSSEQASLALIASLQPVQALRVVPASGLAMPEDSILRRHTLGLLRADIEAGLPERPSDSVLKRHYAQRLACELEKLNTL